MSTRARLARLERAGSEVTDQEHLRLAAAIVLARYRGDIAAVAELRAQLARLPPPAPGGALEATLRDAAARLGHRNGVSDDDTPELLVQDQPAQVAICRPCSGRSPGIRSKRVAAPLLPQLEAG
jgi:hypothetical protein